MPREQAFEHAVEMHQAHMAQAMRCLKRAWYWDERSKKIAAELVRKRTEKL